MKTIGLIGGMSWESTALYYRQLNETVRTRLGGLHSARLALYSVDFAEVESLQRNGNWEMSGRLLAEAARAVAAAGAEFLVLCTNTMHKVAPAIEAAVDIPLLHIADACGSRIAANGHRTVGLLGTRFTMEEDFYRGRLQDRHGLQVIVPGASQRELVDQVIFTELCRGKILNASRQAFRGVIEDMVAGGAQAIMLGCTEIAMLVGDDDAAVPVFDTTAIHVAAAVDLALACD